MNQDRIVRQWKQWNCSAFLLFLVLFFSVKLSAQEDGGMDLTLDSLLALPVRTASKHAQTSAEAPASISIITAAEIQQYNYKTLSDILNRIRGMYTSSDWNYTYVGVRGFSRPTDYNNRILLLVDGHTMNENVYGSANLGTEFGLNIDLIDHIEIVRGPGSALYGTGAMFGVVNVITKDYQTTDGLKISGSAGSYGYKEGSLLWGGEIGDGGGIFLSANYGRENGPDIYFPEYDTDSTNHGVAKNANWDKYYALSAKVSLSDFTLRAVLTSREKGIPTGSYGTIFNNPDAQSLDQRRFIELLYSKYLQKNMDLSARVFSDYYHYEGIYPYSIISYDQSTGLWWGSELCLQWDFAMDHRFIIGAEYQNHQRSDYFLRYGQTVAFDRNVPFSLWSLFAQDEYQLSEHVAVTGGFRYDRYSTLSGTFSPRIAVNWNAFKRNTIKFLAGRAFRAPNFYELYYEDLPEGYKGNASLKPEIMTTWEIAIEQRLTESVQASLSFYQYDLKNLIDPVIDPIDSLIYFYNKSKTTAQGIECEIKVQPHRRLDVYFLFSYQRTEDLNTSEKLSNSPSWLGRAGVSYMAAPWITASMEGSYDSERRTIFESNAPSFALMNSKIIVHAPNDKMSVSLGIRNIFDTRYYVPGGFEHIQSMLPQKGREWFCKVMCSL